MCPNKCSLKIVLAWNRYISTVIQYDSPGKFLFTVLVFICYYSHFYPLLISISSTSQYFLNPYSRTFVASSASSTPCRYPDSYSFTVTAFAVITSPAITDTVNDEPISTSAGIRHVSVSPSKIAIGSLSPLRGCDNFCDNLLHCVNFCT